MTCKIEDERKPSFLKISHDKLNCTDVHTWNEVWAVRYFAIATDLDPCFNTHYLGIAHCTYLVCGGVDAV
jgi:hypothetical protein